MTNMHKGYLTNVLNYLVLLLEDDDITDVLSCASFDYNIRGASQAVETILDSEGVPMSYYYRHEGSRSLWDYTDDIFGSEHIDAMNSLISMMQKRAEDDGYLTVDWFIRHALLLFVSLRPNRLDVTLLEWLIEFLTQDDSSLRTDCAFIVDAQEIVSIGKAYHEAMVAKESSRLDAANVIAQSIAAEMQEQQEAVIHLIFMTPDDASQLEQRLRYDNPFA